MIVTAAKGFKSTSSQENLKPSILTLYCSFSHLCNYLLKKQFSDRPSQTNQNKNMWTESNLNGHKDLSGKI